MHERSAHSGHRRDSMYDNTSVLFDEQISFAYRSGTSEGRRSRIYSRPEDCQCAGEGCPGCRVDFMLSAEGPGTVYSRDVSSTDPTVKPAFDSIPIVNSRRGREAGNGGLCHHAWEGIKPNGSLEPFADTRTRHRSRSKPALAVEKCVEVCPRKVLILEEGRAKATNIAGMLPLQALHRGMRGRSHPDLARPGLLCDDHRELRFHCPPRIWWRGHRRRSSKRAETLEAKLAELS